MSEENNTVDNSNKRNRTVLFAIGLLVGLLFGGCLTILLVDWLDYERPTVVKVLDRSENAGTKDTVVNYVIHKYETHGDLETENLTADSLMLDSTIVEEDNSDFMVVEDDVDDWQNEESAPQNVVEEKMIKKSVVKVVYLDENKHVAAAPANAPAQWQVQQWSTPIKNKLTYQFSNNVLKVKGLEIDDLRIVNFNNQNYIVAGNRTYIIKSNKQFDRMTEVTDVNFATK